MGVMISLSWVVSAPAQREESFPCSSAGSLPRETVLYELLHCESIPQATVLHKSLQFQSQEQVQDSPPGMGEYGCTFKSEEESLESSPAE